jgi:hypothetical protein
MLYTINYEEVSYLTFIKALKNITQKYKVENSHTTDCGNFVVKEYEDGSTLEMCNNSKELILAR